MSEQSIILRSTEVFDHWIDGLKDRIGRANILRRVRRLAEGHAGDAKPVGSGVFELRIRFGPGYRVYYMQRGHVLIVLLCGGDKSTQESDIARAKTLADHVRAEEP